MGSSRTSPRPVKSKLHLVRRRLVTYRLRIAVRVLLFTGVGLGVVGAAQIGGAHGWLAFSVLLFAALLLLVRITRFAERPLREVLRFVEGVRYDDYSVHMGRRSGDSLLEGLAEAFTELGDTLRRLRSEREEQARFLDLVVRHVPVALVAVNDRGEVSVSNPAARKLLALPHLRRMDQLTAAYPELTRALDRLNGSGRRLVRVQKGSRMLDLSMHATRFRLGDAATTLISLQDIRQELEEKELEAWQQLTRVLTHEIVNSVAPIASLASTAREQAAVLKTSTPVELAAVREALGTIERRSEGLVRFVDAYRSLARLPQPQLDRVQVSDLFAGCRMLLSEIASRQGVEIETSVHPADQEVLVDPELMQQVLINLVLNALQALEGHVDGKIQMLAHVNHEGRPILEIVDNGPGIEPHVQDQIFIPFFSTKQSGSGIGLALSRQIVRLHGGTLSVRSDPGEETALTVRL